MAVTGFEVIALKYTAAATEKPFDIRQETYEAPAGKAVLSAHIPDDDIKGYKLLAARPAGATLGRRWVTRLQNMHERNPQAAEITVYLWVADVS